MAAENEKRGSRFEMGIDTKRGMSLKLHARDHTNQCEEPVNEKRCVDQHLTWNQFVVLE